MTLFLSLYTFIIAYFAIFGQEKLALYGVECWIGDLGRGEMV